MNLLKKLAYKKKKEYKAAITELQILDLESLKLHGEKYKNSWLFVLIESRISRLNFKLYLLKKIFKI